MRKLYLNSTIGWAKFNRITEQIAEHDAKFNRVDVDNHGSIVDFSTD